MTSTERWRKWKARGRDEAESARRRAQHRFWRLKRAGLCISCAKPKPPGRTQNRCEECQRAQQKIKQALREKENRSAWTRLEAGMRKFCDRCELRGDHVCLPEHPDPLERRGPGRTYP